MEVSGQLHTSTTLPPEKEPWYPLNSRMGVPQSLSGRFEEEKNLLPLPGIESLIAQSIRA